MRKSTTLFGLATVLGLVLAGQANAELVVNAGFENDNYTGWTQGGDTRFMFITDNLGQINSGRFAAQFAGQGSDALLSQTLATTAGATYHVSYWLQGDGGTPNDFSASFGGQTLIVNPTNQSAFPYTQFNFDVTATTGSSILQFAARDDPGYFYVDDVSVIQLTTSTPEPLTFVLAILGGLSSAGYLALKRRKTLAS